MKIDKFSNFRLFNPTPIYSPEGYASRQHFEQFFYAFYLKNRDKFPNDIEYIPVFWHSYENHKRLEGTIPLDLQDRLDSLDKRKRYFTISSHYSGIRHRLPKRTTVFTAATDSDDTNAVSPLNKSFWNISSQNLNIIKIPLIKNPYQKSKKKGRRSLCNFIGAINTHPCRKKIVEEFKSKRGIIIETYHWRDVHSWDNLENYPDIMSRSTFTLCPRGFGRTSYRLYESMQLGSIPIYFYDEKFLPYEDEINWKDICLMVPLERIEDSYRILKLKTEVDIGEYRENIQKLYNKYFTRNGVCNYILRKLL